jgi:hypothetical protein
MAGDIVSTARIARSIHFLRGQKVMLDFVISRTQRIVDEGSAKNRSQIVTSSKKHRGAIYRPYAFTEEGVAMLSSVGFHVRETAPRYRTRTRQ